jgi:hypothetical protein
VRGPKHVVRRGKTPVLTADEARQLLESIDSRGRAMIGVMTFDFARIGAGFGGRISAAGNALTYAPLVP